MSCCKMRHFTNNSRPARDFGRRKKGFMVPSMKQKYSITVADMELNIISDASPDEVENIVGMLGHIYKHFRTLHHLSTE